MKKTITYKDYTIYLLRDSQTKRVRGAVILSINMTCDSLTQAKKIIDVMTEEL